MLADLGLPDAITIRDLRLGTLINRLRTLPSHMIAASLHRCLMSSAASRSRGVEAEYFALIIEPSTERLQSGYRGRPHKTRS